MILDASKAHVGDLALDYCAATGTLENLVPMAALLSVVDDAGLIVREVGGRTWVAFAECGFEDVGLIHGGDIGEFVSSGTLVGGSVLVPVASRSAAKAWRLLAYPMFDRILRCTSAIVYAAQLRGTGPWIAMPTHRARKWQPLRGKPWEKAATFDEGMRLFFSGRN